MNGKLINHQTVPSSPGAGPRHFAFHPDGHWFYSLNEGASTLTFMTYDPTLGLLTPQEEIPTPPHAFKGTSFTSEVFVSPDGRFVYAANRLHDTIAIFAIGRTGRVTLIEMCSALSLATMTTDSPPGDRGWSPAPVRAWRSPCRSWLWDEGVVKVTAGTRGAHDTGLRLRAEMETAGMDVRFVDAVPGHRPSSASASSTPTAAAATSRRSTRRGRS